ncbi:MAG TPA: 4a-hydroxytetrahydrobiopterin dehydratase, partial [Limnobacter sp.]|nr:4a-hydroxytetrahydrobiopterin dehydratase [Limnobacter sp.]
SIHPHQPAQSLAGCAMSAARTIRAVSDWLHVNCRHCGPDDGWTLHEVETQLQAFDGWAVQVDAERGQATQLWRRYSFSNFEGVKMAVHALMHLADDEDHHPEASFSYNWLEVSWNTHSAGGISDNDWACAAKLDDLLRHMG